MTFCTKNAARYLCTVHRASNCKKESLCGSLVSVLSVTPRWRYYRLQLTSTKTLPVGGTLIGALCLRVTAV